MPDTVAPVKVPTLLRMTLGILVVAAAIAILPAAAAAAPCPVNPGNATAWLGGSGNLNDSSAWSNGTPSGSCDVSITTAGSDVITMTGGANMRSLTLGGTGSTPKLIISDQSPNTNLDAQPAGITIAAGASVVLTCQPGGCPGGGPDIYSGSSPFANAGTITVDANTGGGSVVGGAITNTGTIDFAQSGSLGGTVVNKNVISIANGVTVTNAGSSCGDTGASVKNDTGGTIGSPGSGVLSVRNFEQGNGTTEDVQIPCGGTLNYTGNGKSEILATGGFNLIGEMQGNQALTISEGGINVTASLQSNFTNKGTIVLTCPAFGCNGGPSGGAGFNGNGKSFTNAGTFAVAASSGTGGGLDSGTGGTIVNTGTMDFNQTARMSGVVVNKGKINIADTKVVTNAGGSCGDSGAQVKTDAGGSINATGSGTFDVRNYEQGAGTTSGTNPVQLPCGTVKYTGGGASKVRAYGGFTLTGEMRAGQELTVSAESNNTNVTLGGSFTNKGTIVLTCPLLTDCNGGHGGGVGFNGAGNLFTNAGTFAVAAASGTGAGLGSGNGGTIVNTGTMSFEQSAGLGGDVVNQGLIAISNGVTVVSSASSCGNGANVKNDTGGQIKATGTGTLESRTVYEQGAGTTSGSAPVTLNCGVLKYVGAGASTVRVLGGTMTGNISSGQTMRLVGSVNAGAFSNAGTIVFDQSASSPTLNTGTVTNTGKIELSGSSANTSTVSGGQLEQTGAGAEIVVPAGTKLNPGAPIALKAGTLRGSGTISGSIENTGGVVKPGESPGTLTLAGSYVQGAGGRLEIEVAGTGAGQHDVLALGGTATLNGTLTLVPASGYADSSAVGDSVSYLTYGGTLVNQFAQTVVSPPLSCGKAFSTTSDVGGKALKATVVSGGATCSSGGGNDNPPPPPPEPKPVPSTKIGTKPKATVKTKQAKAKVKFTFSSVGGTSFQCKLDKGAYKPCASPQTFKAKPGKHKFSVRAVGPGGTDPTPATFSFKVIKQQS